MPYDVEVRRLPDQPVASVIIPGIRRAAAEAALAGALPDVFSHLTAHAVDMVGHPFVRYHEAAGDAVDLEVGIPVGGPFPETASIVARVLPGGEAAVTAHVGGAAGLDDARAALARWRAANGRELAGPFWQIYLDDPLDEAVAAVRTEVVEPLRSVS